MLIATGVILILAAVSAIGFGIWKWTSKDRYFSVKEDTSKEQKIYISRKGVNLDSGSLGGGTGELFRGTGKESMDTVVMSQELATGKIGSRHTICLKNLESGRVFQGNFSNEIMLGRGKGVQQEGTELLLPFSSVSRRHCRIVSEGNEMFVEDLGSTFGTYVNGGRVIGRKSLLPGSVLKLGEEEFAVE